MQVWMSHDWQIILFSKDIVRAHSIIYWHGGCTQRKSYLMSTNNITKGWCWFKYRLFLIIFSFIFQMHPSNKPHMALVISPLRSLMKDQVSRCAKTGIESVAITRKDDMSPNDVRSECLCWTFWTKHLQEPSLLPNNAIHFVFDNNKYN